MADAIVTNRCCYSHALICEACKEIVAHGKLYPEITILGTTWMPATLFRFHKSCGRPLTEVSCRSTDYLKLSANIKNERKYQKKKDEEYDDEEE